MARSVDFPKVSRGRRLLKFLPMRVPLLLLFALPSAVIAQIAQRPTTPGLTRALSDVRGELSGERALATTAFVAQYWRLPGNSGFNASLSRVAAILDSAGFVPEERAPAGTRLTYRIERRSMRGRPTWEPLDGSLTIVGHAEPILRYVTTVSYTHLTLPTIYSV